jgi:hypothetical protein
VVQAALDILGFMKKEKYSEENKESPFSRLELGYILVLW